MGNLEDPLIYTGLRVVMTRGSKPPTHRSLVRMGDTTGPWRLGCTLGMSPAPHAPPIDLVTDDFWQHLERDAFYSPVPFPIHVPPVVGESAHDADALARQILERFFHAFNIPSVPYFDGDRPTIPDLLPFSRERSDEVE